MTSTPKPTAVERYLMFRSDVHPATQSSILALHRQDLAAARAEAAPPGAGLREALASVEWGEGLFQDGEYGGEQYDSACPSCHAREPGPHAPECVLAAALALPVPEAQGKPPKEMGRWLDISEIPGWMLNDDITEVWVPDPNGSVPRPSAARAEAVPSGAGPSIENIRARLRALVITHDFSVQSVGRVLDEMEEGLALPVPEAQVAGSLGRGLTEANDAPDPGLLAVRRTLHRAILAVLNPVATREEHREALEQLEMAHDNWQLAEILSTSALPVPEAQGKPPKETGVSLIAAERQRQITEEGYGSNHDSGQGDDLAEAAASYAVPARWRRYPDEGGPPLGWPWDTDAWKPVPGDRVRELVKAGALIAAAIDATLDDEDADRARSALGGKPPKPPTDVRSLNREQFMDGLWSLMKRRHWRIKADDGITDMPPNGVWEEIWSALGAPTPGISDAGDPVTDWHTTDPYNATPTPSGLCSAHREGEDPFCRICYPVGAPTPGSKS